MNLQWDRDFTPHKSHKMTKLRGTIRCPASTPRFYSVSECVFCELEMGISAAGEYYEPGLELQCCDAMVANKKETNDDRRN